MVIDKSTDQREAIRKAFASLDELPSCLPNSCVGYLEGYESTSVDISNDTKYFAAGFSNSEIHLWSLTAVGDKIAPATAGVHLNPLRLNIPAEDFNDVSTASASSPNVNDFSGVSSSVTSSPISRKNIAKSEKSPSGASILRGHFGPVHGLSFFNSNLNLISCSEDTTIRLWDLNSCKNTHVYTGHIYPVWCIDTSPLDLYFVTGSRDTSARLWTFDRLYPLRIFVGHLMDVDVVKFHPNASYVASGSPDKTVRLWDVNNGRIVRLFEGHKAGISSLAFSPDGKNLISGGEDGSLNIWDLQSSRTPLVSLNSHKGSVTDTTLNTIGSVLISGSSDGTVKYWSFKSLRETGDVNRSLLHSLTTKYSLTKLKMLPHNVIYIHGHKI